MDSFLDPLIITSSCHYPLWYSDCPYFVHWHASISFSPSISFEHPLSETIKCHALFELLLYHPWNHQFFKGILNHEINILKYLKTEVWALSILITCYRISLLLGLLSDKAGKHIFFKSWVHTYSCKSNTGSFFLFIPQLYLYLLSKWESWFPTASV